MRCRTSACWICHPLVYFQMAELGGQCGMCVCVCLRPCVCVCVQVVAGWWWRLHTLLSYVRVYVRGVPPSSSPAHSTGTSSQAPLPSTLPLLLVEAPDLPLLFSWLDHLQWSCCVNLRCSHLNTVGSLFQSLRLPLPASCSRLHSLSFFPCFALVAV